MIADYFQFAAHQTTARTEIGAGVTTFVTMAYIIFVQPAVLSGQLLGVDTGMDFGAVTTATCLAAAFATLIMGLHARYPVALAPGMGQNFFFVTTAIPVAASLGAPEPWRAALGAIFVAGVVFMIISLAGIRRHVIEAVSPSVKHAIGVGIGLFIAFIGLRNAQIVTSTPQTGIGLTDHLQSVNVAVFVVGFLVTVGLDARRVRGAILWGVTAAFATTLVLQPGSVVPAGIVSLPPSVTPTLWQFDFAVALSGGMIPIILMVLFMDVFDTTGTLIGVAEQAGMVVDNKLPRVERAMLADAAGTVAGAVVGTSTVTSYVESAAGVAHGGRTGLTAVTAAGLFLLALFFFPVIEAIGGYPPITAPALVFVGAIMVRNVARIDWEDPTEAAPAFLTILGIPLFGSIGDGIGVGLLAYPVIKVLAGRRADVSMVMWALAVALGLYFLMIRPAVSA